MNTEREAGERGVYQHADLVRYAASRAPLLYDEWAPIVSALCLDIDDARTDAFYLAAKVNFCHANGLDLDPDTLIASKKIEKKYVGSSALVPPARSAVAAVEKPAAPEGEVERVARALLSYLADTEQWGVCPVCESEHGRPHAKGCLAEALRTALGAARGV